MVEDLNRFERARLIGARALQLSMGAPPLVEVSDKTDPVKIAFAEFDSGVIPIVVIRE
jgi:DNA-directed RNA polymerase subunit K